MVKIPDNERIFLEPYAIRIVSLDGSYTGNAKDRKKDFELSLEHEIDYLYSALSSKSGFEFKSCKKKNLDSLSFSDLDALLKGFHNCPLPKGIKSYFTTAELFALYSSIGKLKQDNSIQYKNSRYNSSEIINLGIENAYSILISSAWSKNPNFYNQIAKETEDTQKPNALKKRINQMNYYQKKRLEYELIVPYIDSFERGNPSGWHDPNSDGQSKTVLLKELKSILF
jgi:hypothetical protein